LIKFTLDERVCPECGRIMSYSLFEDGVLVCGSLKCFNKELDKAAEQIRAREAKYGQAIARCPALFLRLEELEDKLRESEFRVEQFKKILNLEVQNEGNQFKQDEGNNCED